MLFEASKVGLERGCGYTLVLPFPFETFGFSIFFFIKLLPLLAKVFILFYNIFSSLQIASEMEKFGCREITSRICETKFKYMKR